MSFLSVLKRCCSTIFSLPVFMAKLCLSSLSLSYMKYVFFFLWLLLRFSLYSGKVLIWCALVWLLCVFYIEQGFVSTHGNLVSAPLYSSKVLLDKITNVLLFLCPMHSSSLFMYPALWVMLEKCSTLSPWYPMFLICFPISLADHYYSISFVDDFFFFIEV